MKLKNSILFGLLFIVCYSNAQKPTASDLLTKGLAYINSNNCLLANVYYKQYKISTKAANASEITKGKNLFDKIQKSCTSAEINSALDADGFADLKPIPGGSDNEYVTRGNNAFNKENYKAASEFYFQYILSNEKFFDSHSKEGLDFYKKIDYCLDQLDL